MRMILFLIILIPCYAFETIICERINGTYDCYVWSKDEVGEYLENVITVYESDGMNTSVQDEYPTDIEDEENKTEIAKNDFVWPLIFPMPYKSW
jgi:hypothetical protein